MKDDRSYLRFPIFRTFSFVLSSIVILFGGMLDAINFSCQRMSLGGEHSFSSQRYNAYAYMCTCVCVRIFNCETTHNSSVVDVFCSKINSKFPPGTFQWVMSVCGLCIFAYVSFGQCWYVWQLLMHVEEILLWTYEQRTWWQLMHLRFCCCLLKYCI